MRSRLPRPHEHSRSFSVSEGSAADHVRFSPESGQIADISASRLCADFVVKVAEEEQRVWREARSLAYTQSGGWGLR